MDLQKFCERNDHRNLHKPIRSDGHLYATNGHIAIRIADEPSADAQSIDNSAVAFMKQKFAQGAERTDYLPLAALINVIPTPKKCDICNGTGKDGKCDACDGKGKFQHGNHTYDCKDCGGSGALPGRRWNCDGDGHEFVDAIPVGHCHFAHRYVAWLLELPWI